MKEEINSKRKFKKSTEEPKGKSQLISGFLYFNIDDNSCQSGFSVTSELEDEFSVLLLHEKVYQNLSSEEPSSTYGVVEFAFRNLESDESWDNLLIILIGFTVIGFLWIFFEKRNK